MVTIAVRNLAINATILLLLAFIIGLQLGVHNSIHVSDLSSSGRNMAWHFSADTVSKAEKRHEDERLGLGGGGMGGNGGRGRGNLGPGPVIDNIIDNNKPVSQTIKNTIKNSLMPPTPTTVSTGPTGPTGSTGSTASKPPPPPPQPPQPPQPQEPSPKTMKAYLSTGQKFTLVVLACNRPDYLKQTLDSLLDVDGVRKQDIIVIQDGNDDSVIKVVDDYGLNIIHNNMKGNLRGRDGAAKIATQYKFAISNGFDYNLKSPAIIIIEDDFLFSPDFLSYFESNSPILDEDPSTFIMSAWNDNGLSIHVSDEGKIHRTNYFPGLGWLMPRKLWEEELENKWPKTHWDHWMRDSKQHKNRYERERGGANETSLGIRINYRSDESVAT
ncbi:hypothetical protein TL16_g05689 [Triparma laevis f. inornata]|uniref:alpha-1,3-mannosyl-glycoprotein 2-beta-N-acetylglucosaminyltransferase n=1 Tax=Triparma laevis f. inornata TaxID=1714386 RepID=A0A9W7ANJ4_9STRA|nr:hypothetical protein TL16_g05689 [Triparma laevis f. inornata]